MKKSSDSKVVVMVGNQEQHLPEDLVLGEIVPRLPVKCLLRLKCVSRHWYRTISDPKLLGPLKNPRKRLAFTAHDTSFFLNLFISELLVPINDADEFCYRFGPVSRCQDETLGFQDSSTNGYNIPYENVGILASYNGMLLLYTNLDLFIMNPTTRQCRMLALPLPDEVLTDVLCCGMCYDPFLDEYKVVLGTQFEDLDFNPDTRVVVGGLKSSTWKEVPFDFFLVDGWGKNEVVINDKIHWVVENNPHPLFPQQGIVYFDVITEKFVPVPVPEHGDKLHIILGLGILDGCLSMTQSQRCPDLNLLHVWVMKEYGVKESWSKLCTIQRNGLIINQLLETSKDGQLLVRCQNPGKIQAYNPKNESLEDIVSTDLLCTQIYFATTYEESLFFPPCMVQHRFGPFGKQIKINGINYWSD